MFYISFTYHAYTHSNNNLTDKKMTKPEKLTATLSFFEEDPLKAGTIALVSLGKRAIESKVSLTFSCGTKVEDKEYTLRMHISAHDSSEKDILDQKYLIRIYFLSPRNKLEKTLQECFQKYKHQLIDHAQVKDLETIYNSVLEEYKANNGRSFVAYTQHTLHDGDIHIWMGEQIIMDLIKVTGDFFYTEKEDANNE